MKPNTYLNSLKGTLIDPHYYVHVLNKKIFFSLRFLFISYLIIGLAVSAIITQVDFEKYQTDFQLALQELERNFPENLQINYQGYHLSMIPEEEIVVDYPQTTGKLAYQHLAVINPNASEIKNSSALITLGADQIWIQDAPSQFTQFKFSELSFFDQRLTITKQNLPELIDNWQTKFSQILEKAKVFVFIFFPLGLFFSRFLANLLDVLLIFLILKISNYPLNFTKIWQLSFHVLVVAEVVAQLTGYLYPDSELKMFAITYWIWFAFLIFKLRNIKTVKFIPKSPKN